MNSSVSSGRTRLRQADVVAAALEMVELEGPDALTFRRLATKLGIAAPSLYEHVRNKDELIDLVVQTMLEVRYQDWAPPPRWQDVVRQAAEWLYQTFMDQPLVLESYKRRPFGTSSSLRFVDSIMQSLIGAGFTPRTALLTYANVFGLTLGFADLELSRRRSGTAIPENPILSDSTRDLTQLRANADELWPIATAAHLAQTVDELVLGLEARSAVKRPSRSRRPKS